MCFCVADTTGDSKPTDWAEIRLSYKAHSAADDVCCIRFIEANLCVFWQVFDQQLFKLSPQTIWGHQLYKTINAATPAHLTYITDCNAVNFVAFRIHWIERFVTSVFVKKSRQMLWFKCTCAEQALLLRNKFNTAATFERQLSVFLETRRKWLVVVKEKHNS